MSVSTLRTTRDLPAPSRVGTTKVGGIDLNKPRMRWVVEALCLSLSRHGFTTSESARQAEVLNKQGESEYGVHRAAYNLKKLRARKSSSGPQAMITLVLIRNKRSSLC